MEWIFSFSQEGGAFYEGSVLFWSQTYVKSEPDEAERKKTLHSRRVSLRGEFLFSAKEKRLFMKGVYSYGTRPQ
jgi:hypothetical protein